MANQSALQKAVKTLNKKFKAAFSTTQALACGIHPRILYQLRDNGIIESLSRGVFIVSDKTADVEDLDLLIVSHRVPKGVVCLESALSLYGITTQVPRSVMIALPKGMKPPRLEFPPVSVFHFSKNAFENGVNDYEINGEIVKVYSPEKTIADCFKFRNQLGMEIILEALNLYKENYPFNSSKILYYAKICRVQKIIFPYLEAMVS